jgi:hypothetical protein
VSDQSNHQQVNNLGSSDNLKEEVCTGDNVTCHSQNTEILPRYISAIYDTSEKTVYCLTEENLQEFIEGTKQFQEPMEEFVQAIAERNTEVTNKVTQIGKASQTNGDTEAFNYNNQASEQKAEVAQQQIDVLQAENQQYESDIEVNKNSLANLKLGTTTENVTSAQTQSLYEGDKSRYEKNIITSQGCIKANNEEIEKYQAQVSYPDVKGYHEPVVKPENEVKPSPSLESAQTNLVNVLKPYSDGDSFKEFVFLVKGKIEDATTSKPIKIPQWAYLAKPVFDKLKDKYVSQALSNGSDGTFSFSKSASGSKAAENKTETKQTGGAFGSGSTSTVSNESSNSEFNYSEMKNAMIANGASFQLGDFSNQFGEDFNGSVASFKSITPENASFMDMDTSIDAKLLRYTSQLSTSGGFTADGKSVAFIQSATASLDIFDAKATAEGKYPTKNGVEIILQNGAEKISLGVFLLEVSIDLFGKAGAEAMISHHIEASQNKVTSKIIEKVPQAEEGEFLNTLLGTAEAGGKAGVFGGIEVGCSVTGKIKWSGCQFYDGFKYVVDINTLNQPEPTITKYLGSKKCIPSFQEAGQLEFSFAADAGGGACAAYHIGYDGTTGQFTFSVSAQVCFGVGWSGKFSGMVNANTIKDIIFFLYKQLQMTNFNVMQLIGAVIDLAAYQYMSQMMVLSVWLDKQLEDYCGNIFRISEEIQKGFDQVENIIASYSGDMENRVARMKAECKLAEKVVKMDQSLLTGYTPLAKGNLLYEFSNFDPIIFESHSSDISKAILLVLKTITNATEFLQVLISLVDTKQENTIPATEGAKKLVKNISLTTNSEIRDQYMRILAFTQAQYNQSTAELVKNDLLAAYQCLSWCAKVSVFVRDNSFDIKQLNNISASDKQSFAMRMQQPNLIL